MDVFKELALCGLVPVVTIDDAQDAAPLCRALEAGGLNAAEITLRTDAGLEALRLARAALPDMLLGAGTVLSAAQADAAMAAGAQFIVSPGLNPDVVAHCLERGYPVLPGCATPSDIERALSLGVKTVKLFPAGALGGAEYIQAISAPYGGISFMPTGGVTPDNLNAYLACPRVIACGGSWVAPRDAIARKDWALITRLADEAVKRMLGLELRHVGLNNETGEQAMADARTLSRLLGWPVDEREKGAFVGTGFEVLKFMNYGERGHIAIATNSVPRAMRYVRRNGFDFEMDSISYRPDGQINAIYLDKDIAGFRIHLLQK